MKKLITNIIFIFTQIIFVLTLIPYSLVEKVVSWRRFGDFAPNKCNLTNHKMRMRKVQEQVKKWRKIGIPEKKKMCSGRKVWQTISPTPANKNSFYQIDIGELTEIVELDVEKKTIKVEPGMMMGRLTGILTKIGWTIPVVPELDTLTVGGLIAGGGIETSSHKYGPFHDTILEMEILLPTGEIVTCSKDEDPDLFYATPGAYGTLGFILSATLPLLPAGRFVKLQYRVSESFQLALKLIENEVSNYDFIEGIAYSEDFVVVMLGNMVDQGPYNQVNNINKWNKPFFYKHAEQDYVLPLKHTLKLHQLCVKKLGIYPVWICPAITTTDKTVFSRGKNISQIFIDLGYYGYPTSSKFNSKTLSELVDDCIECEGGQGMYGHDFVSREQMQKMVDGTSYENVYFGRSFSEAFPHALEKICRK